MNIFWPHQPGRLGFQSFLSSVLAEHGFCTNQLRFLESHPGQNNDDCSGSLENFTCDNKLHSWPKYGPAGHQESAGGEGESDVRADSDVEFWRGDARWPRGHMVVREECANEFRRPL